MAHMACMFSCNIGLLYVCSSLRNDSLDNNRKAHSMTPPKESSTDSGASATPKNAKSSGESMSLTTHWHIQTNPDPTTPPYPDQNAQYLYLTGCAMSLKSANQGKDYDLTQFSPEIVNCERCKIWLSWKHERVNDLERNDD